MRTVVVVVGVGCGPAWPRFVMVVIALGEYPSCLVRYAPEIDKMGHQVDTKIAKTLHSADHC